MPGQQTVDPKAYILNVLGVIPIQYKKGTMITITRDSDAYTDDVSGDGFVTRFKSADQRATIKFTLDQASPSNDQLSALAATDALTGSGTGAVLFKDLRGTTVASGANAWIKKLPDAAHGTENESREWEIRVARLSEFIGGTTPV